MAGQPEVNVYDASVYQWERVDPVEGAIGGIANAPLLNLANRTNWLKHRVDSLIAGTLVPPGIATLDGSNFTGATTAPNVADGNDSTLIANTHFVQRRNHGIASINVAGTASHTCTQPEWGVGIIFLFGTPLAGAYNLVMPAAPGQWIIYNGMSSGTPMVVRTTGGFTVSIVQGAAALIWCDGTNMYRGDNQLTLTGEVKTADLATTGVGAGAYTKTNISVGVDGRITGASNGVVSFADVVGGLGFTPVQQGGGVQQGTNKVYFGWDATNTHMRVSVDVTDVGNVAMFSDFGLASFGSQTAQVTLPTFSVASRKFFFQFGSAAATHSGSGVPEITVCPLAIAFPNTCLAVTGSLLGTTPPNVGSSPAFQPFSASAITVTTNYNQPVAALGCVYFALGY